MSWKSRIADFKAVVINATRGNASALASGMGKLKTTPCGAGGSVSRRPGSVAGGTGGLPPHPACCETRGPAARDRTRHRRFPVRFGVGGHRDWGAEGPRLAERPAESGEADQPGVRRADPRFTSRLLPAGPLCPFVSIFGEMLQTPRGPGTARASVNSAVAGDGSVRGVPPPPPPRPRVTPLVALALQKF